jgi:hypothetical protein
MISMQRLITAAFYAYAFLLAPKVTAMMTAALRSDTPMVWPGFLILAALVAETVALPWAVAETMPRTKIPLALGSCIGIAHVLLTYFLGFTMLDAWGVLGGEEMTNAKARWLGFASILLFFREGYLLFASGPVECAKRLMRPWKSRLGMLLMLAFQCIAYTVYWDALMPFGEMGDASVIEWIFVVPAVVLIFYIAYLPLRVTDLVSIYAESSGRDARRGMLWVLFTGAVLAVLPLLGFS